MYSSYQNSLFTDRQINCTNRSNVTNQNICSNNKQNRYHSINRPINNITNRSNYDNINNMNNNNMSSMNNNNMSSMNNNNMSSMNNYNKMNNNNMNTMNNYNKMNNVSRQDYPIFLKKSNNTSTYYLNNNNKNKNIEISYIDTNHINNNIETNFQQQKHNNKSLLVLSKNNKSLLLSKHNKSLSLLSHHYLNKQNLINTNNTKINQNNNINKNNNRVNTIKILTQSDLTQNINDQQFNNSCRQGQYCQSQYEQYKQINQEMNNYKYNIDKNGKYIKYEKEQYHNQFYRNMQNNHDDRHINKNKKQQQKHHDYIYPQSSYLLLHQQFQIPEYKFINNQKLQIKYYQPQLSHMDLQQFSLHNLINLLPHHNISQFKKIKRLILIGCQLSNLNGLQYFQSLQQFNIRQNNIKQVQEIYRIKNKQKILSINIMSNDIQYYHQAIYINLRKVFPNLQELNNKNYSLYNKKNKYYMKKVITKTAKLEYQLKNTLKKQIKKTNQSIYKFNPQIYRLKYNNNNNQNQHQNQQYKQKYNKYNKNQFNQHSSQQQQQFQTHIQTIFNKKTQQDQCHNLDYKKTEYNNNKIQVKQQEQNLQYDNDQIQQKNISYSLIYNNINKNQRMKKIYQQKQKLKQVSLGNLENVPITMSLNAIKTCHNQNSQTKRRCTYNKENINTSNNKKINNQNNKQTNLYNQNNTKQTYYPSSNNRNFLQIKTQQQDENKSIQIHQPTATFAMQKQKQLKCISENRQFMFKNNKNKNNQKIQNQNNINNNNKSLNLLEQDQQYEHQCYEQNDQMSLSRISKMSQIPTKRLSSNHIKSNIYKKNHYHQDHQYKHENEKSKIIKNQIKEYQNDQSFIFSHQQYQNNRILQQKQYNNKNNSYLGQNNSCLGYSQISQLYRINQSMDEDCLLKNKKDLLEEEQYVIVKAIYLQNIIKKAFLGLILEKKKNSIIKNKSQIQK